MPDPSPVSIPTTGTVQVAAHPAHYYEDPAVQLRFANKNDFSIDQRGAAKSGKPANAPADYVTELQRDLIALGYLANGADDGNFGAAVRDAVFRFQRHARRVYRMPGPADVAPANVFTGSATGEVNAETATEIRKWISHGWVLPLGRFTFKSITVPEATGTLREDAAVAWEAAVKRVTDAGGTLAGPYGNTRRSLDTTGTPGSSKKSFHYSARAIDIQQGLAGGAGQRYYIEKEPAGAKMFWRIWCRTEAQDGTQGRQFAKGERTCFSFWNESDFEIKAGWYIDMTEIIESAGDIERISAQTGWDDTTKTKLVRNKKAEWWHFQFIVDVQETFLDEMELVGVSAATLLSKGWTDAELKAKPG